MELIQFDEMKKNWHQIAKHHDGDVPSTFELEIYGKLLSLFHIGNYYFYIFNAGTATIEFTSEHYKKIIGYPSVDFDVDYIFENIHPHDKPRFIAYEQTVTTFFNKLPPDKVLKYKVSYDYRLRCKDRKYKWILQQVTTVQSDDQGSVIRVLGVHTDITHMKTDNKGSGLSFLGLEGEPSFYNVPVNSDFFIPSDNLFSPREKEVLTLVLSGKSTIEIASIMNLSIHTINCHRKNLFSKSGCSNLAELGFRAFKEGWIL